MYVSAMKVSILYKPLYEGPQAKALPNMKALMNSQVTASFPESPIPLNQGI